MLRITDQGDVRRVALDRPPDNAMTAADEEALIAALRDGAPKVVVLETAGKHFFNGTSLADIRAAREAQDYTAWTDSVRRQRKILMAVLDSDAVVIARVSGHAVGYGATLALACDIVVAADHVKIGDPHVRVGLTAGDGGAIFWPALVGLARARYALLTGALMRASEAQAAGLIHAAVPAAELDAEIDAILEALRPLSPIALRTTKRAINIPQLRELVQSLDAHLGLETISHLSNDHAKALADIG